MIRVSAYQNSFSRHLAECDTLFCLKNLERCVYTMKKLLASLLFALVLCTLIPFAATSVFAAEDEPTIQVYIQETDLEPGDEFEVTVNLLNIPEPGLIGALVKLGWNEDVMELVTYYDEDEEDYFPMIEVGDKYNASSGKYISYGPLGTCNVQYNRATAKATQTRYEEHFFTATFRIKEDAEPGDYSVYVKDYNSKNMVSYGNLATDFAIENATITIGASEPACEHEYFYNCDTHCMNCGELTNPDAAHSMIHVEAVAATCTSTGNIEYWYCEYCGGCWDNENAAGMPLNRYMVTIPAEHEYTYTCDAHCAICHELTNEDAAHNVIYVEAKAPTCTENGNIEYWYCGDCGSAWLDAECTMVTNLQSVKLGATCATNAIHSEGVEPGCHYTGWTENWYCANCDVYYLDADCTIITNYKSLAIPALQDTAEYVPAKDPTCTGNGNVEYWICYECEQVWADEALTQLTNIQNVQIATDADKHASDKVICISDGADTHTVYHSCCRAPIETVPHDKNTVDSPGNCVSAPAYTCTCEYSYRGDQVNSAVHAAGDIIRYKDITADKHTAYHPCCGADIATDEHSYVMGVCYYCENVCDHSHGFSGVRYTTNGDGTHKLERQCTSCYLFIVVNEKEACSGGTATCTAQAVCVNCSTAYGPEPAGHNWTLTGYEWTYTENFEDYSCTAYAKCSCGETTNVVGTTSVVKTDEAWCYMPAGYCWTAEFNVAWAETQTMNARHGNERDPERHGITTHLQKIDENTHQAFCYYCQTYLGEPTAHDKKNENFAGNCLASAVYTCTCGYTYEGELNSDNHAAGDIINYKDNEDGTHTAYHPCCETDIETVDHTYDATTHKCVCGKVEEFVLIINDWLNNVERIELSVSYGENIMEALKAAAAEGKIPAIGDFVSVNDEFNKGVKVAYGYRYIDTSGDKPTWAELTDEMTMPAGMLETEVDVLTYGWWYNYNEDGVYVGAEYYDRNDEWLTDGWYFIEEDFDDVAGGAWYYFAPGTGEWENFNFRVEDIIWTTNWDNEAAGYYAFDHETGKWLSNYTGIYEAANGDLYYINKGVAVKNYGLFRDYKDGEAKYYYFGCDQKDCTKGCNEYIAQKNGIHWAENTYSLLPKWDYEFDANGVIVHDDALNNSERPYEKIEEYDGKKYYTIDGIKVHAGLVKMDGNYYYARSSGELVVNATYWCTDVNGLLPEGNYTFDEKGRMVNVPEIPEAEEKFTGIKDGYYYENGVVTYAGLIEIDGAYYYVKTSGEIVVGRTYWITKTNGLMGEMAYTFDEEGKMKDPVVKELDKDGIVLEGNDLYYYVGGMRTYAGLIKIGANYYYVNSNGQVITGKTYWISKTNGLMAEGSYTFDETGKMVNPPAELPEVEENFTGFEGGYYYENGVRTYAGLIEKDGAYYYVNTQGQVITGKTYWITKTNGLMEEKAYTFDEEGKMILN